MPVGASLDAISERLEATVFDATRDPADRVRELKRTLDEIVGRLEAEPPGSPLARDLGTLAGRCQSYLGSLESQREGENLAGVFVRAKAAEDAAIRARLEGEGLSEADLSEAALEEAGFGAALDPALLRTLAAKRHRDKGRFANEVPGIADLKPKGRGGAGLTPAARPPKPPKMPRAPTSLPEPVEPELPAVTPQAPGENYDERRDQLQRRAHAAAAKGVASRPAETDKPQSPGGEVQADTSPTPDSHAPRQFGHASQKELLAYANSAVSQPTTVDTYATRDPETGRRIYDESRRAVHERIISALLDHISSQEHPRVLFTGGGYASGKGSVVDNHEDVPQDALIIDPDKIKAELPEFQALLEEDPEANLLVYEEAWDISQELQRRAIAKRTNVVVDGISDTSPDDMLNRVKLFTDAGYEKPKLVTITIPTDEAIGRAEKRAKKAKKASDRRFIPEVVMRSVHRDVSATMPGIIAGAKAAGLDIEVWDNNQGWDAVADKPIPPKPIFNFDPVTGEQHVGDTKLWDDFLAKAHEKIEGVDPLEQDVSSDGPGATPQDIDAFVDKLMADNPQRPGEEVFNYQSRICDALTPDLKHDVIFRIRERYPPVPLVAEGAARWRAEHGLPEPKVDIREVPASLEKAGVVAPAFDGLVDASDDPHVVAAFDDFKRQNDEMYDFITKPESEGGLGITVEIGDPTKEAYPSAEAQAEDVRKNKHFTVQSGLGGDHTLMTTEEYDRFRAVHDIFGHVGIGGGFDRHGEFEAWLSHMSMYTGPGRDAMSSEYHGVNTSLWAGEHTPTGKSVLMDDALIQSPWGEDGNLRPDYGDAPKPQSPGGEVQAETVGVTPFREGQDDPEGFFGSAKFQSFESEVLKQSDHFGVTLGEVQHNQGVFKGGAEPSVALSVNGTDQSVRGMMASLGKRFDQESVASFTESPDGDGAQYKMSGIADMDKARQLAEDKLGFASLGADGSLVYWDADGSALDAMDEIASELGLDFEATQGHVVFIGSDSYDEEIRRAEGKAGPDQAGQAAPVQEGRSHPGSGRGSSGQAEVGDDA